MATNVRSRLTGLLQSSRVVWLAAGVALVLNLPSVPSGWHLDDLLHRANFLEVGPLMDSTNMTHRMFDFLSGDPEEVRSFKDLGVLPWWSYDSLKIRFWRPLSSFTHVVDYRLWPNSAVLMHLHNVVWLAALVLTTGWLYRKVITVPFVAGLATLLYALDDAHGLPTGFLANRNALITTTFGVLAVVLLDRYRRDGWAAGSVLSPIAFGLALLAGESGIGAAPYLLGYALFLDPATGVLRRLAPIVPHSLLGGLWLVAYKIGGYGTNGSGFYLDPLGQPAEWLSHFIVRAPLLLLGQWFVPPSSFAFAWTASQKAGVAAFGVLVMVVVFWLVRPILKREPVARFFAFGMLFAVVPITAGFPHDRLLFFVGIGAMGLLSMLLCRLFDRHDAPSLGRAIGWALVAVHVVIAVPLQVLMTTAMASQEPIYAGPTRSLPDDSELAGQRLIVVNPPSYFYAQYDLLVRRFDGRPAPESMLMMAPGTTRLMVHRPAPDTLEIAATDGYLISAFDNVYRAESLAVPVGYEVALSEVRVTVSSSTPDGRPHEVRFQFAAELESDDYRWVRYDAGRYVAFDLPAVGERVELAPVPFSLISPNEAPPTDE